VLFLPSPLKTDLSVVHVIVILVIVSFVLLYFFMIVFLHCESVMVITIRYIFCSNQYLYVVGGIQGGASTYFYSFGHGLMAGGRGQFYHIYIEVSKN